jgi:hypothetical protein
MTGTASLWRAARHRKQSPRVDSRRQGPPVLVVRTCETKSLPATTVISRVEDSSRPGCDEAEVPINEIESHRRCRPAEPARGGGEPTACPPRPSTIVVVHKAPRLDRAIHRSQRREGEDEPEGRERAEHLQGSSEPLPVEGGLAGRPRRSGRPSGKTLRRTSLRGLLGSEHGLSRRYVGDRLSRCDGRGRPQLRVRIDVLGEAGDLPVRPEHGVCDRVAGAERLPRGRVRSSGSGANVGLRFSPSSTAPCAPRPATEIGLSRPGL